MSKIVRVSLGERSYDITIERGALSRSVSPLAPLLGDRHAALVSDSNVLPLWGDKIPASAARIIIQAGEESKNFTVLASVLSQMAAAGLDRSSAAVALGGGVTGDITGFAAACYMRGIAFIQIPTTLLAMVDSSVGGKTGVDLPEGKNLAGAFWQPRAVIIDPDCLSTLPKREILCGLAEIVKYAVIIDPELFEILDAGAEKLLRPDLDFYTDIIARCCEIKARIVSGDERESGLRAILNFGHTFGHAFENVMRYSLPHGEAVSAGMAAACLFAVRAGMLQPSEADRVTALLKKLSLPVRVPGLGPEKVFEAMGKDKKKSGSSIRLVLPDRVGSVKVTPADGGAIMETLREFLS